MLTVHLSCGVRRANLVSTVQLALFRHIEVPLGSVSVLILLSLRPFVSVLIASSKCNPFEPAIEPVQAMTQAVPELEACGKHPSLTQPSNSHQKTKPCFA